MQKILTQEDLDNNPILQGCSVGDELTVVSGGAATQGDHPVKNPPVIP